MKNFLKKLKPIDILDIIISISFIANIVLSIMNETYNEALWIGVAFLWFLIYASTRRKLDEVMEDFENYIKK